MGRGNALIINYIDATTMHEEVLYKNTHGVNG